MNKKWTTVMIILLLLVLGGYIVFDMVNKKKTVPGVIPVKNEAAASDKWTVTKIFDPGKGQLNAVYATADGNIILGGESFVAFYTPDLKLSWESETGMPVTAVTESGNDIYAAVQATILVFSMNGEKVAEWGPFEDNSMITSLAANETYVAFADAANKAVFVLDKQGVLKSLIGRSEDMFIVPSPYFDIALDKDGTLFVANTGNRRIEKRNIDGTLIDFYGKPGIEPDAFCGCCNPAHFALIPGGFITAEKGINRIKILNTKGEFVEFVSSVNNFVPPLPLDVASPDGQIIYGANPADSKLYVYKRK